MCLCLCICLLSLCSAGTTHSFDSFAIAKPIGTSSVKGIIPNQIADMKLAFLGIPEKYVNQSQLTSRLQQVAHQFAFPNTISWTLDYSFVFCPFPKNVSDLLRENAFYSGSSAYYNVSLLESLLSQYQELAIPDRGYLLTFMWIPNATDHSWFYIEERSDLFFNMTYYYNGTPYKLPGGWPPHFGGLRRTLYFDISEIMENATASNVTSISFEAFVNSSLEDIFPNLGGFWDTRLIEADTQTYRDYKVKILWLNGTGGTLPLEVIRERLEDLMPWASWTVTIETRPADDAVNNLVKDRIRELPTPINQTYVLSDGTRYTMETRRTADWTWSEYDPMSSYLINHVKEYFNLTDMSDKSVIPVILLQLENDVAGSAGGVCLFPYSVIMTGLQGSLLTDLGEYGQLGVMYHLTHEIGHWVSLAHHSDYDGYNARVFCGILTGDPRSGPRFCAFCKDARARMSYKSYYDKITALLSNNQTKAKAVESELNDTVELYYNWEYAEAVKKISYIYFSLDTTPPRIIMVIQIPSRVRAEDSVTISAMVTDDLSGVKRVTLNYTDQNVSWITIDMTNIEGDVWSATIPAFPYGTNVTYIITISDNFNNLITSLEMGYEYHYSVIPEFSSFPLLPVVMIASSLAVTAYRRKHCKSSGSHKIDQS